MLLLSIILKMQPIADRAEFDGSLRENASVVDNGKIGKCLQLRNEDGFAMFNTLFLGLTNKEFSITAWVKLNQQSEKFLYGTGGS